VKKKQKGWQKMTRELTEEGFPLYGKTLELALLVHLVNRVSHKQKWIAISNHKPIVLEPGDVLMSLKDIQRIFKVRYEKAKNAVLFLERYGYLAQKRLGEYSVLQIPLWFLDGDHIVIPWDPPSETGPRSYSEENMCSDESDVTSGTDTCSNSEPQKLPMEPVLDSSPIINYIYKNTLEYEEYPESSSGVIHLTAKVVPPKKKKKTPKPKPEITPECYEVAKNWREYAMAEMPWLEKSWKLEKLAEQLTEVKQKTDLTDTALAKLLEVVRKDKFWRDKAVSVSSLLKKKKGEDLRKIDHIIPLLRTQKDRDNEGMKKWLEDDKHHSGIGF
jgi:hypothetical protein